MLADLSVTTLGSLAAVIGGAVAVGGLFGRTTSRWIKNRQAESAAEEAKRQDELRLRESIRGRDADEYNPRRPGLIEMHAQLAEREAKLETDFRAHVIEDNELARQFREHVRGTEIDNGTEGRRSHENQGENP